MVFDINYLAVVVAAVVAFFLGWAWFSPMLFMKQWMEAIGMPMDPNFKPSMTDMAKPMILGFVQQLVTAYVLAHFAIAFGATDAVGAVQLAVWVWVGFVATVLLAPVLWEKRSWKWYTIVVSQHLVGFIVMSLILVLWH